MQNFLFIEIEQWLKTIIIDVWEKMIEIKIYNELVQYQHILLGNNEKC